ncbi:hypothetical protein K505DRAFT_216125, partial [Melanomma pulvis-pyrius CBS 109.77]
SSSVITSSSSSTTVFSTTSIPTSETPSSTPSSSSSVSSSESSSSSTTTEAPSSSSSSSEIPSTTISSSSSTSSCVPTQTNAVVNPSFETGGLLPWVMTTTGRWNDLRVVGGRPHSGTYSFFGATDSETQATLTLTQTDVVVLAGTVVDCSGWVWASRNSGYTTTFTVSIDDQVCGTVTVVDTGYIRIGSQITVSGDTHTVSVQVVSTGADEASMILGIDDVSVVPISGPGV